MVMHDRPNYLPIDNKVESMQRNVLPKCCYQMRIGYITYYNTPDNLRISLEENLIEISAKNSENHKLRINTNTFVLIALQCNAASYVMSCMYLSKLSLVGRTLRWLRASCQTDHQGSISANCTRRGSLEVCSSLSRSSPSAFS